MSRSIPLPSATWRACFLDSYRSNGAVTTGGAGERGGNYVRAVVLDALLAQEPRLDVVKMDIEGHEPIALRGMTQTLTRHHPVLFFEFHPRLMQENFQQDGREYLRALLALGYRLAVIPEHGEELPLGEVEQVMDYWRQNNARLGLVDEAQLDLVAGVVGERSRPEQVARAGGQGRSREQVARD